MVLVVFKHAQITTTQNHAATVQMHIHSFIASCRVFHLKKENPSICPHSFCKPSQRRTSVVFQGKVKVSELVKPNGEKVKAELLQVEVSLL